MSQALIGLGSNEGDRRQILDAAIDRISHLDEIVELRKSAWRVTKAIGGPIGQPDFLNGAALLETSLSAEALLAHLQQIEIDLGRRRAGRWGPRTIDLDLLLLDDLIIDSPQLTLPHPRMAFRRFVLEPAAEVAGSMRHPIIGWTIAKLLNHLQTAPPYVAISSSPFARFNMNMPADDLARAVANKIGWDFIVPNNVKLSAQLANSPSLPQAAAIEFLADFAGKISSQRFTNQNSPIDSTGAISSAWIEDMLAIGDVLWPGVLDEACRRVGAAVVPPKLLVVLPSASDHISPFSPGFQAGPSASHQWLKYDSARLSRTRRSGIGPVLRLDAADHAIAEQEIIAAIQAMN
ncbi:MAG TPA: 2-amino-4-hydroxy-6-hydroxymethyldihydropteridine diphosphokinase [Pirellulales bacterium]